MSDRIKANGQCDRCWVGRCDDCEVSLGCTCSHDPQAVIEEHRATIATLTEKVRVLEKKAGEYLGATAEDVNAIAALTEKVRVLEAECALWRSGMASPAYLRMAAALREVQTRRHRLNDAMGYPFVEEYVDTALAALDTEGGEG